MSENPFNRDLDWAFRGSLVAVAGEQNKYVGVCARVHYNRGSVLLYDASILNEQDEPIQSVGSVFIRTVQEMYVVDDGSTYDTNGIREIDYAPVDNIVNSPYYDAEIEVVDDHMRSAYRNQFTGSFPVCRVVRRTVPDEGESMLAEDVKRYELINGHKRIAAARKVGLKRHPVEVIDCTDEQARELVELAHSEETTVQNVADALQEEFGND